MEARARSLGVAAAPGISASATHGLIRTAHAVRALDDAETPPRLAELADGLAYWASTYQELPTRRLDRQATEPPGRAINRVAIVPADRRRFAGTITSSLNALADFPEFADVIDCADLRGDPSDVVSDLTATFARVYIANAHDPLTTIVFVHSVTSVAAVRSLLPHLNDATAQTALRYIWQIVCALFASFGSPPEPPLPLTLEPSKQSRESLIDMTVACGDEHAIKFTEACLREDAIASAPEYRAAAHHAITMLSH